MPAKWSRHIRKKLPLIVLALLTIIIFFALSWNYYHADLRQDDPRIVKTRVLYDQYARMAVLKNYREVFKILDSIEVIYAQYQSYRQSFEMGTIYSNRAGTWLAMALNETDTVIAGQMLDSSKYYAEIGIRIYENWMNEFAQLSRNEIILKIKDDFNSSDTNFKDYYVVTIINKRTDQILTAQTTTRRKLSYAYTNLSTICKKKGDKKNSMIYDRKAREWWKSDPTATGNFELMISEPDTNQSFEDTIQ